MKSANQELSNHNKRESSNVMTVLMYSLMILGLAFTNCSDEETITPNDLENVNLSEVQLSSEIDATTSGIGDIIIDAYEGQELNELGRSEQQGTALPDCVTITVVAQQGFREVTLDFGTDGCLVNGHLLQGQIVFSYTRNPEVQEVLITYDLINFYFDAKNILGSKTILKQFSNDNGNPQFTHTLDVTVIWPSGAQASREGLKVKEWIEGFGSGVWSDNVFEVTGNWTTTFVNGNTHSYDVLIPLRREVTCFYFVSGTVDVERTNFGGVFDYGDGECDNQATFTSSNGNVFDITLNWQ